VHCSNFGQFVSKSPLGLKKTGQNEILRRRNAAGISAQGAALAPDVPDLIALSAAKRPEPG
jgi:hypothetical protein